jgi:hypothetical protein
MSRTRALFSGKYAGRITTVAAAAIVSVAVAAPLATGAGEGSDLRGGKRNGTFSSETKVIANNSAFGTRQSNLGAGGGAIYGCRAQNANEGCIEASNLSSGQAFNFRFRGALGGTINTQQTDKTTAKPFTTNATGVATGLNADRVDGMDAQQIVDTAAAQTKTAIVGTAGNLGTHRGITAVARESVGRYLVTADANISQCVPTGTAYNVGAAGANVALEPVDATRIRVYTQNNQGQQADRQFSLAINC